jgi:hypothetical protein
MSSQQAAQGVIAPQGNLAMSMMILDNSGVQVGMLGELLRTMLVLQDDNMCLWVELDALLSNITAQGGVVLDGLGFTTEAQVRAAVLLECPLGDAFKVFLNVVLLFCCNPMYAPVVGLEKTTHSTDEDYSATARKVVSLYHQTHCAWYMEGKIVVPRKVFAAFKDADNWNGIGGLDGRRHKIEMSANLSAKVAQVWVGDKLPGGRKLAPLALKMINRSVEWIYTVHKHLDMELTKLTQQHIAEEEALILLFQEMIIMYMCIHAIRKSRMEFVASRGTKDKGVYMVRCIWVICQVHRVMQEFVQGELKYNSTIGTAFI